MKLGCPRADRLTCCRKFQDIVAARLWHGFWTLLARFTVTKIRPRRLENHALQGYGGFYLDFKGRPGRLGQDLLGQPTREQCVTL